jgi:pimeloyl-ACP methyl ester carboxylesterase
MLDVGSGPPLVLIPGIQGRWEWMRPAIDALARECRVITSSLPGEPGVGFEAGPGGSNGDFDLFVSYVDRLLDSAGITSAFFCGVSFGGLIALRYATRRSERVRGLILVSTPGPRWRLKPEQARYLQWPILSSPVYAAGAVRRFRRELRALYPNHLTRLTSSMSTLRRILTAPAMPQRMGRRARLAEGQNFEDDCARVSVPTLIVTGDAELDRMVPCDETMRYLALIPGAQFQRLERTGHLGTVLAPDRFAAIVSKFLNG